VASVETTKTTQAVTQPAVVAASSDSTTKTGSASETPVDPPQPADDLPPDPGSTKKSPPPDGGPFFLCHKRRDTLTFSTNSSLDYRRHVDHGDPMNQCPGSAGVRQ
jgi:hypothetical protein